MVLSFFLLFPFPPASSLFAERRRRRGSRKGRPKFTHHDTRDALCLCIGESIPTEAGLGLLLIAMGGMVRVAQVGQRHLLLQKGAAGQHHLLFKDRGREGRGRGRGGRGVALVTIGLIFDV